MSGTNEADVTKSSKDDMPGMLSSDDIDMLIPELIEIANDAFLIVDNNGFIKFANRGVLDVSGYDQNELYGEHIRLLIPDEFHTIHEKHFQSFKDKGPASYNMSRRVTIPLLHKKKHKVEVGVSISKRVLKGQSYFGVIITDLSILNSALCQLGKKEVDLTNSLAELRRAEERFMLAQELAQIGSWDWDVASGELFWSKEVFRIFGLEPGSISPTYEKFLSLVYEDDREDVVMAVNASLSDPAKRYDIKHRIVRPDGQVRVVREIGKAEFSDDGEPRLMVGSIQDVTETEKLQEQMSSALLREVEANKSKSEFLANLSHELRTPLNAVIGYSSLISSLPSASNVKIREYAEDINHAGEHLNQLVSDILEISTIDLGIVCLNETTIDLVNVIRSVHAIINARATERSISISYEIDEALPKLEGDELRIKQILVNLISNSIKFSEPGTGVKVSVSISDDANIYLVVEDNGCGMDKDRVHEAVKRFNRLHSSLNSEFQGGLGLGLSMVKSFCELHGADLNIDSEEGVGTKVCIVFPNTRTVLDKKKAV